MATTPTQRMVTLKRKGNKCCHPPYGRAIGDWMAKAYAESKRGALVVCLVPARTEKIYGKH